MEPEKNFKIWFDEESGILRSEVYKPFNTENSIALFDEMSGKYTEKQQRYILVFLGENAQDMISKETRRVFREKGQQSKWKKIAIYGAKPGVRMLAKVILTAIGRGNATKFFATEKECLEWLKAEIEEDKAPKKTD